MKKNIAKILSVVLAVSCLFSLIGCYSNLSDILKVKSYWENVSKEKHALVDTMVAGIDQLAENQQAYLDGVQTYEAGQQALLDGEQQVQSGEEELAAGQAQYDEGAALLEDAHAQYEAGMEDYENGKAAYLAGVSKLEKGKAEYAEKLKLFESKKKELEEGKALLESKRPEYEAGKQKLAEVTAIYNICKPLADDVANTEAQIAEAQAAGDRLRASTLSASLLQKQLTLNVSLGGYSIASIVQEYEDGLAQIAEFEAGEAKIREGEAALAEGELALAAAKKTIEDGEKELAAAAAKVAAGEKKLASSKELLDQKDQELAAAGQKIEDGKKELDSGRQDLKDGEKQLADGAAQLKVYEDGQLELAAGLDQTIGTPTHFSPSGEPLLTSISERLGSDFTYWTVDSATKQIKYVNNAALLDLSKARLVADTAYGFMDDTGEAVTEEVKSRLIALVLVAIAALCGLVAAVFGLMEHFAPSTVLGFIAASMSIVSFGMILTSDTQLPYSSIAGSVVLISTLVVSAFLAIVTLGQTIAVFLAKSEDAPAPAAEGAEA